MLCCYQDYIPILFIVPVTLFITWLRRNSGQKSVCIVVLGDIGRSPRMQYHAISLTRAGFCVNIVGYGEFPRLLGYGVKASWQSVMLILYMLCLPKPSHLLLQNPPSIPTMAVCWLVCLIRGTKYIIDWHNYGYTLLGLAMENNNHKLVRFSNWFEHYFGKLSAANICVTNAMKDDLKENWNIRFLYFCSNSAETHYDRPPEIFKSIDLKEQHVLFVKLASQYKVFQAKSALDDSNGTERTVFTVKLKDSSVHKLQCRPALLVSSTSWTDDEDFSVLLNALKKYEEACENPPLMAKLPKVLCVITGKGPNKEDYMKCIEETNFKHIDFCTPWLEAEDYPKLLASADLGVCLHISSSGLDLPMKVVDMFGSGLPVSAICFKCLPELVKHEENGMVFHCGHELAQQLQELFQGFPERSEKLEKYRKNLKEEFQTVRWHDTWTDNVLPLFS